MGGTKELALILEEHDNDPEKLAASIIVAENFMRGLSETIEKLQKGSLVKEVEAREADALRRCATLRRAVEVANERFKLIRERFGSLDLASLTVV